MCCAHTTVTTTRTQHSHWCCWTYTALGYVAVSTHDHRARCTQVRLSLSTIANVPYFRMTSAQLAHAEQLAWSFYDVFIIEHGMRWQTATFVRGLSRFCCHISNCCSATLNTILGVYEQAVRSLIAVVEASSAPTEALVRLSLRTFHAIVSTTGCCTCAAYKSGTGISCPRRLT